jgi:hypothetical protein
MAKYTRKEFAEKLCGMDYSDKDTRVKVSQWVKRGNIIEESDGLIDDSIEKNREWAIKQYERTSSKESEANGTIRLRPDTSADEPIDVYTDKQKPEQTGGVGLERIKLKKQIEKLDVENRILNLREDKIRGEVIPIDLVKTVFTAHAQSIITANKEGIEEMIINFSKEATLSSVQVARLRGKMIETLNRASDKATDMSKRQLKSLIEEFSIKKEVGEHG